MGTNIVHTDIVKNITISVEETLWTKLKDAAASDRVSMNVFIRETLNRALKSPGDSAGEKLAALFEKNGPAPRAWKWNRDEIYEDAI